MDTSIIYITAPAFGEAEKIADTLVEERLAACVNIIPQMKSVYRWEGKINRENEVVLIAKTKTALVEKLTQKIKSIHSYSCPCIVSVEITGGNPDFIEWIVSETA